MKAAQFFFEEIFERALIYVGVVSLVGIVVTGLVDLLK